MSGTSKREKDEGKQEAASSDMVKSEPSVAEAPVIMTEQIRAGGDVDRAADGQAKTSSDQEMSSARPDKSHLPK